MLFLNRRVAPGNGPNSFLKNRVMHPCSTINLKQLESVTFQGSVCAIIQAIFSCRKYKCRTNLFVVDVNSRSFLEVNKRDFDQIDLPTFDFKNWTVKYRGCEKGAASLIFHIRKLIMICEEIQERRDLFWFGLNNSFHSLSQGFRAEGDEKQFCKYVSINKSNLFVLNVYKKSFLEVHRNDFKRRDLPCFKYKNWTIKYEGKKDEAKHFVIQLRQQSLFRQETLSETYTSIKTKFNEFLSGLSAIFEVVASIGRVSNDVNSKYMRLKTAIINPLNDNILVNVVKSYGVILIKILLNICRVVNDENLSILNLSSLVLDVYSLVDKAAFKAETLETILIAGISTVLPASIVCILKKMTILTNKKLFDDNGFIFEFFSLVSQIMFKVISFFPLSIQEYLSSVLDLFGLTEFLFIFKAQKLLDRYNKDKHVILSDNYRQEVKDLSKEFLDLNMKRFFAKNKPLHNVSMDFERIHKAVVSYEQTSRQEPCCFVFQGPPGCRKSVTVNKVIKTIGLTHYSHIVKCSEDSKDWYDAYNNEEIFYMDDVGQMGKSQWRNLINWVSAVKLPLDCAEASLKDTKYFNSEIILLTTNNFTNLQGFTTKDCIEHPEALWRRGYVFDFQHVKGEGNLMKGVANFKYYDIRTKQFVQDFPQDFREFLQNRNVAIDTYCDTEDQNAFLLWLTTIIMGIRSMKKLQLDNNTLVDNDIKFVRDNNPFIAESKCDYFKNLVFSYFEHALEVCKQLLSDFLCLVMTNPVVACGSLVLGLVVTTLIYKSKSNFQHEGAFVTKLDNGSSVEHDSFEELNLVGLHSMLPKITTQMFEIDMVFTEYGLDKRVSCHGLISGRRIVVPYHLVLDRRLQVTVYKDRKDNHRIIDHSPVELIYKNVENDVAIVSLSDGYPSPFPKLASCFQPFNRDPAIGLVFPNKIIKLEGIITNPSQYGPIVYPIGEYNNKILDPITYKGLHYPGMCGAMVVSRQGFLLGMHVAGHDGKQVGVTLQWSSLCRQQIFDVLSSVDNGLKLSAEINNKVVSNCSGLKLNTDMSVFVPKNSNFVKSPLYGVFEISRKPANLSVYGPHTVKDVSKSSRIPIGPVKDEELNFASDLLDLYFEDFDDLNEYEIVKGDDLLAPINKKSSNGIFPIKDKLDCFDFEKGIFKPSFKDLYDEFEKRMTTGDIDIKDIAWSEILKDELRNTEKKEPRSFRVSPVSMQVLTKKCFGKMVKKIVRERWFNEIMIGLNPFSEWPKLYQRMQGGRCWGGDIGKYDKCMRVQVQIMVAEKILKYYKGSCGQAARNILLNIAYNLVVVNDDSWILTHSLPSGCWLTAIFNSLVNRVYTAMWYYREMSKNGYKPDFLKFHDHISDPVYGDDRLNRCIDAKYQDFLNAITMEQFFNSLGMEMTDSLKNKIETPFQPVHEITFLKRYFRFHPKLGNVTCPLDLRTVYSTLSWIDSSKEDPDTVLRDKINAFQREIFLHYDIYHEDINKLENFCAENNIYFSLLTENYLIKLYLSGNYDDFYSKAFGVLIN